jgi:hypothetical protein
MKLHYLKTIPPFFEEVERGVKTFEVRRDDRDFSVGDVLVLQEYDGDKYTGKTISRLVIYKLEGGQFGLEAGYCVLGLGASWGTAAQLASQIEDFAAFSEAATVEVPVSALCQWVRQLRAFALGSLNIITAPEGCKEE